MALSSSSTWDLTMALGGRAGHSQQATPLHPQVSSSISSHCSSFSSSLSLPSDHHTLTHCGGSCCRLATWPAGPWVTSSFCVAWRVAGRCLCPSAPCARLQVCLPPPSLCCVVEGRALCVYGLLCCGAEGRSVSVFPCPWCG
jgi:hypothetical protein